VEPFVGSDPRVLTVLILVWMVSAMGSGLALAFMARRIHPALSLRRLWIFYSLLMGFLVAVVMILGFA
jgi:hypothetical protein